MAMMMMMMIMIVTVKWCFSSSFDIEVSSKMVMVWDEKNNSAIFFWSEGYVVGATKRMRIEMEKKKPEM